MATRGRFDAVTIMLHWLTVLLFVPLLASMALLQTGSGPDPALLIDIHRGSGAALLATTAIRFLWRQSFARLPPFPQNMRPIHRRAVTVSEWALYVLLLAQPLTGLAMTIARGRAFRLIVWQVPALMGRDKELAALLHDAHRAGAYFLLALVGLHASAALIHHYLIRDDVLAAMLPVPTGTWQRR